MERDDLVARSLRLCLRARWDPKALQEVRASAGQDAGFWEAVSRLAQDEGLASLLYRTLLGKNPLPRQVEQDLRTCYLRSARRNFLLFRRLEEALRHLGAAGVPVLLLKGAALALDVYANPSLRPMADLDLLIRRADMAAALRVLQELGYVPRRAETRAGDFVAYENEVLLTRPGELDVNVELHWSLFDSPYYQYQIPMDWFWETARAARLGQTDVWVLAPEAQLLHLCGHQVLHHGADELKWLWRHDVAELIACHGRYMDWDELLARVQAYGLVLAVRRVLAQLAEEEPALVPPAVLERVRALPPSRAEERVVAHLTAACRPVARRFWNDLVDMPGWRQRVRFARSSLFPSAVYMRQRYGVSRRCLLPFYYLYRWFLGLRSALGMVFGRRSDGSFSAS